MSSGQLNHYVPRFLLRGFTQRNSLLFAFDKQEEQTFPSTPKGVAAENSFYDLDLDEITVSFEPGLAELDGLASRAIEQLRSEESVSVLTRENRYILGVFLAVQLVRVRHFRDTLIDMSQQVEDWLRSIGFDPSEIANFKRLDDEDAKLVSFRALQTAVEDFAPYFIDKLWFLLRTDPSQPFIISDNPVALHNAKDMGMFGNLGLGVPGIEIFFPISSRLCLHLVSRSYEEQIQDIVRGYRQILRFGPQAVRRLEPGSRRRASALSNAFEKGAAVPADVDNVTFCNSLQVRHAARWIFGRTEKFELAKRMIDEDERYRTGPFMKVGWPRSESQSEE